jgi:adenylate kinase family enzyme
MAALGVGLGWGVLGVVIAQASVALAEGLLTALIWAGSWWTRVRIGPPPPPPSPAERPRRIAILGGAGSGKSTLARQLGAIGGGPVTHLDRLVFGPSWVFNPLQEVRQRVAALAAAETWVIEGTWPQVTDLILPRADLVVWIDQPAWLRLWRCWRKMQKGRRSTRPDRPGDCEDSFGWAYAAEVLRFGAWSTSLARRLEALAGGTVLRLRGDAAVARFLGQLAEPATPVIKTAKPGPCPTVAST